MALEGSVTLRSSMPACEGTDVGFLASAETSKSFNDMAAQSCSCCYLSHPLHVRVFSFSFFGCNSRTEPISPGRSGVN